MFTTGTATSHTDLLDQIHDWAVDCGWTSIAHTAGVSAVVRAPGDSVGNEYFLFLSISENAGAGAYAIRMRGGTQYDSSLSFSGQIGVSPAVFFNVWNNAMDYFFYGNVRNIKVVARVNVSYVSMYAGLFLPFALPTLEYIKPFYIGANGNQLAPHDVGNSRNRFIADPGIGSAYFLDFAGSTWLNIYNSTDTTNAYFSPVPTDAIMWPHRSLLAQRGTANSLDDWAEYGFLKLRPNKNGEMPSFPCHLVGFQTKAMIGVLEGVYSVGGFGKVSEQLQTIDGRDFRLFQNIFRTTPRDFMAIEEVA